MSAASTPAPGVDPDWTPDAVAERLEQARVGGRAIPPLTAALPRLSIDDAYAIQRSGLARRLAAGERLVGRKIGLTSEAMQEMLGVRQPDFGYLLESMVLPSEAAIDAGRLIAPRVEAEIAFVLGAELRGPGVTVDDVLTATAELAPALEVIDSRIADWRIQIADTIADNASSALVVLGERQPLADIDPAALEMTLDSGGERVGGRGEAVLGHPAAAVAWLANALGERGESIAAGQLVLPGAMARALAVGPGSEASASFERLGEVAARFTAGVGADG